MPELPDIAAYLHALEPRILDRRLDGEWLATPFLLRSVDPPLSSAEGRREWAGRLCAEAEEGFPEKVTAFRPGMSVHGRFGEPFPVCGASIQRIRYAANETNYCAACQTGGKVLADRALSRLLGKDWRRTLEELETLRTPDDDAPGGEAT